MGWTMRRARLWIASIDSVWYFDRPWCQTIAQYSSTGRITVMYQWAMYFEHTNTRPSEDQYKSRSQKICCRSLVLFLSNFNALIIAFPIYVTSSTGCYLAPPRCIGLYIHIYQRLALLPNTDYRNNRYNRHNHRVWQTSVCKHRHAHYCTPAPNNNQPAYCLNPGLAAWSKINTVEEMDIGYLTYT